MAGLAITGRLNFDLALAGLAGGLAVLGWIGCGLFTPAILFALLLTPLGWHFLVAVPAAAVLERTPAGQWLSVEGTVRERWLVVPPEDELSDTAGHRAVRLLLGEARIAPATWGGDSSESLPAPESPAFQLAELEVEFPVSSAWPFRSGRQVLLAGSFADAERNGARLRLRFSDADFHFVSASYDPGGMEALRARARVRAAYYLGKRAQAVYLPLVLDLRERTTPEGRDVIGAFRRVGISHLFAISGLNIAMIFGLLMMVQRYVTWVIFPGQGWVHGRTVARVAIVALIWAYIALIGYPLTAVRAAIMGTVLIWADLWGTRTPGLYVLAVTGLAMLAAAPSVLYDVSFQLSFLAYFYMVQALEVGPVLRSAWRSRWSHRLGRGTARGGQRLPPTGPSAVPAEETPSLEGSAPSGPAHDTSPTSGTALDGVDEDSSDEHAPGRGALGKLGAFAMENLWVTLIVTMGLWPIMAARFHNLSLLVFAGNLLLVPAMELVLLPLAMGALLISLACAAAPPDIWIERGVFALLEAGLTVWAQVVHALDWAGGALVFRVALNWGVPAFALYHGALLASLWGGAAWARGALRRRAARARLAAVGIGGAQELGLDSNSPAKSMDANSH